MTIAQTNDAKWARRSVFWLNNRPLLVCEVFLPALLGVK
ncbi:MAG: chorismate lyase [Pontibacterium sp.]